MVMTWGWCNWTLGLEEINRDGSTLKLLDGLNYVCPTAGRFKPPLVSVLEGPLLVMKGYQMAPQNRH